MTGALIRVFAARIAGYQDLRDQFYKASLTQEMSEHAHFQASQSLQ